MSPIVTESRQRSRSLSDLRLPNTSNDISPVLEAMQTEMAEMKKKLQETQNENTRVLNRNEVLANEIQDIKEQIRYIKREGCWNCTFVTKPLYEKLEEVKEFVFSELDEFDERFTDKIKVVEDTLDVLEREMKESELEIEGLYKLRGENLIRAVMRIGQEIKCPLEASDIKSCFRKPSKKYGKLGNVVVKFNQSNKRNNFLHSYNANADNTDVCVEVPLTSRSQNLLYMINKNNYGYHDVFTENGKLYVQEYSNSEVICVKSEDDLP